MRKLATGHLPASPEPVTIRVPFVIRRRGGRRTMMNPGREPARTEKQTSHPNTAFVHALAKAFRWRKLIEMRAHPTLAALAKAEKINPSYASRILRLTLLAPDIVEAILGRRTASEMSLAGLLKPFPVEWAAQIQEFSGS